MLSKAFRPLLSLLVAIALLAEFTKAAEVLSDLGGCEAKLLAKLKRGNASNTFCSKLIQLAQVSGQTTNNVI